MWRRDMGVTPAEFIDVKALMGDTADNIPGQCQGVGEKTATKIIQEYHTIENAYEHVEELKPPRASKKPERILGTGADEQSACHY